MLIGHMVTKNEASRYLDECLSKLTEHVDKIHIYDDRSEDNTIEIAAHYGATVDVRPPNSSSFLDHEGVFREQAWQRIPAEEGDWILCLDADEFLTADPRPHMEDLPKSFHVREVFDVQDDSLMVRVDGYWNQITATRLVPWTDDSGFLQRPMGCGSVPAIYMKGPVRVLESPQIVHYGYARPEDREAKFNRYKGLTGHNPRHVASIVEQPRLQPL